MLYRVMRIKRAFAFSATLSNILGTVSVELAIQDNIICIVKDITPVVIDRDERQKYLFSVPHVVHIRRTISDESEIACGGHSRPAGSTLAP